MDALILHPCMSDRPTQNLRSRTKVVVRFSVTVDQWQARGIVCLHSLSFLHSKLRSNESKVVDVPGSDNV